MKSEQRKLGCEGKQASWQVGGEPENLIFHIAKVRKRDGGTHRGHLPHSIKHKMYLKKHI